jgi:LacI family transcriptional regulator
MEGYRRALAKRGLAVLSGYIVDAGYQDETGHEAMRKLLGATPRPDGVFCYNDPVAIGAMRAIAEAGLRVPDDIAVVGAGNVHYSDFLAVPLTTVDQGTSEIGKRAADLLLERIGCKRKLRSQKILIEPRLVIRQSTAGGGVTPCVLASKSPNAPRKKKLLKPLSS